jgi:uncharacterized membrane protein YbhN (UPF0104 family)
MAEREPAFRISPKQVILWGVVALILMVGAVAGIGQLADYNKMLRALEHANKWWFALGLAGEIAAYVGYVIAYRDVARAAGGPRFDYWTATRVVIVGFGAFIAGSSFGTLGVDYWALYRAGEKPHQAVRRVLALNTLEWGILAVLAMLAGAVTLAGWGEGAPDGMEIGWLATVPLCVAAAIWVSQPVRAERLVALPRERSALTRDPRTWPRWLWRVLRAAFADAIGGVVLVRYLVTHMRDHWRSVAGFVIFWAGDIFTMWTALMAFNVHVALAPLVLAYTTAYVVTSLPLPAGGSGGVEAGLAFTLTAVGVPLAPALLATLVYRFYTLWLPILIAAAFVPQVPKLNEQLPRTKYA